MKSEALALSSVDTFTAARLTGVTQQAIQKRILQQKLPATLCDAAGVRNGAAYRIPVAELPLAAQVRYKRMLEGREAADADLVGYQERYGEEGLLELLRMQTAVEELALLRGSHGIAREREARAAALNIGARMLYAYEKAY